MITREEALMKIDPRSLDSLLHPKFEPEALKKAEAIRPLHSLRILPSKRRRACLNFVLSSFFICINCGILPRVLCKSKHFVHF